MANGGDHQRRYAALLPADRSCGPPLFQGLSGDVARVPFLNWIRRDDLFHEVREAALRLHDPLEQAGVRGYPKTSGGVLHIYVPRASEYTFERVRGWVKAVGRRLTTTYLELIAVASGPTHRGGRVTIDYGQNSVGS